MVCVRVTLIYEFSQDEIFCLLIVMNGCFAGFALSDEGSSHPRGRVCSFYKQALYENLPAKMHIVNFSNMLRSVSDVLFFLCFLG